MDVAIWGAGKFGQYVIRQFLNSPTVKIKYVIDKRAGELKEIFNIPVVYPMEFKEKYADHVEIVLTAFMNGISAIKELRELQTEKIGVFSNLVYEYKTVIKDDILKDQNIIWCGYIKDDLPIFPILETNVVDYCNLNCKGCSHFSNIFPQGSKVAFENFESDIRYLSKKVHIIQFNLLGGEALLSDDLEKYINCLTDYMPATAIQLVTNGILIPNQSPERLGFLAKNNVYVSITEYPPVTQMKEKISKLLGEYGIHFKMRQLVSTFGKNIDVSGENDPWTAQCTCRESRCHFLREGKIYKCPFSALGNYFFEHYNILLHFNEGIDIYNEKNDWKEIINNLDEKPIDQCRFCGSEERFTWAVSVNPKKEEWMI